MLDSKPLRYGLGFVAAMGTATLVSGWKLAAIVGLSVAFGMIIYGGVGAWRAARARKRADGQS